MIDNPKVRGTPPGHKVRIGIDTLFEDPVHGSSAINYLREIARRFTLINGSHHVVLLCSRANRHLFDHCVPERCSFVTAGLSNEHRILRILSQQTIEGLRALEARVDVLFAPGNVYPLWWRRPVVLKLSTLHHMLTPDQIGWLRVAYRRQMFNRAVRSASVVLANTSQTRQDIIRLIGAAPDRVKLVYEAVGDEFNLLPAVGEAQGVLDRYQVQPGFVLFAATLWKYKNPLLAANAFVHASKSLPEHVHFVVAGHDDDGMAARIEQRIVSAGLRDRYRYLGSVPNNMMPALLRQAGVLMYPSSSETFGKPLVEANRCGLPVLAADIPTLREVGQDAAWYLPIGDPSRAIKAWSDALTVLYRDPERRASLVERGRQRGEDFSWQRTAEQTLNVVLGAVRDTPKWGGKAIHDK